MFRRNIEGGKVIEIFLDLRALGDAEAHLGKDFGHFVNHLTDGVDAAGVGRNGGQGDVQFFRLQALVQDFVFQRFPPRGDGVVEAVFQRIQFRAEFLFFLRRHFAKFPHHQTDTAFFAKCGDPDLFKGFYIICGGYLAQNILFQ